MFALLTLAAVAFSIETELAVDTAQPRAQLTQIETEQGGSLDLRIVVRENGRIYRGMSTNDVYVFQYSTNRSIAAWCVWTNTAMSTSAGSVLVPVGPVVPSGAMPYEVYCRRGDTKYPLGSGYMVVVATTGYGADPSVLYTIPLNTDIINQTGTNKFARLSDVAGGTIDATARASAAYAYSPTNKPTPASLGAASVDHPFFATVTNLNLHAFLGENGWWSLVVVTNLYGQ
jgi:hypothetical protein